MSQCPPDAGQGEQAQRRQQHRECQHGREVPDEQGCHPDADDGDDQAGVTQHEEGGDGLAAPPGRGQPVGRGQAAQEDGAHGNSAHDRPGQEQASAACARAATIRASAARNRPRPASTTRRLLNRDSRSWVTVPTAISRNTTAPWTAWLPSCSTPPTKVGASAENSPSSEKAANAATPAAT